MSLGGWNYFKYTEAGSLKQLVAYPLRSGLCTRDAEIRSHLLWLVRLSSVRMNVPLEVFIPPLGRIYTTSLD